MDRAKPDQDRATFRTMLGELQAPTVALLYVNPRVSIPFYHSFALNEMG
ncbi:MAG: hypothetical protein AAGI09_12745 [Pseudomonadota bacterium]